MTDELQNQETPDVEPDIEEEELELSHTDKLVGVFTEPSNIFSKMAHTAPKVVDWLIPVLVLIVVVNLASWVLMSNPNIRYAATEKIMERVEKQFDDAVAAGQMTQDQADQQLESVRERVEEQGGFGVQNIIGAFFMIFIFLFIIAGVYFLCAKFILKGEGTYGHALAGYGLTFYIAVVQWILIAIVGLLLEKSMQDLSLATLMDADKSTFVGWLLAKVDVFAIWIYAVIAIAYAKLFKSESTAPYFAMIFGLWIGFSLLFFFLAKAIPFLGFFTQM